MSDKCNHKRKIFVTNTDICTEEKEVNEIVSYLNSSSKNEMQREIVAETLTESFWLTVLTHILTLQQVTSATSTFLIHLLI